jgi:hypothetical protein
MLIRTGIQHNHRCIYRLIGRDLYSAHINRPIEEQSYTLEKANVVADDQVDQGWRVVVRGGEVSLEKKQ